MRQVKCRNCSKFIDRDKAISVERGKARIFYCNEDCRQQAEQKKNAAQKELAIKDDVYRLICDIIGRKEIINGILWKEWALWNKVANNETIKQYLEENKDYLCNIISKLEDKEFNRVRYLSSILKNHLGDYNIKMVDKQPQTDKSNRIENSFELFEPTMVKIAQDEPILYDVEDDLL